MNCSFGIGTFVRVPLLKEPEAGSNRDAAAAFPAGAKAILGFRSITPRMGHEKLGPSLTS